MMKPTIRDTAYTIGRMAIEMKDLAQIIAGATKELEASTAQARFFRLARLFHLADAMLTLTADLQNAALTIELEERP